MDILFLLTQDINSPSGLGRYWPFCRELAQLGHNVSIAGLHPDYDAVKLKKKEIDGVSIEYVAQMHVKKKGNLKGYFSPLELIGAMITATWRLSKIAVKSKAQIIHICKPHPMNGIAGLAARVLKNKIIFLDCDDYEAESNRFSTKWQRWGVALFERLLPHMVKTVTSNSMETINRLKKWGVKENKIIYLPNGVDRLRFSRGENKNIEELRASLNLGRCPVVAYIGSLSLPSHPVNLLVEAFALVVHQISDAILLIVGGGEDLPEIQSQCQELGIFNAVRIIGRVPPESVPSYFQLATVTVDPVIDNDASRGRVPLKMFESWASGIPFVSAPVGDRRLLAGDPPAALLVSPGNISDLATAIIQIIESPELQHQLGERGLHQVRQYYWEKIAERSQWIYQR